MARASSTFSVAAALMTLRCFGFTQLSCTADLNDGGEWKRSRISVWMLDVVLSPMIFNFSSSVFGSDGFLSLLLMSSWSFLTYLREIQGLEQDFTRSYVHLPLSSTSQILQASSEVFQLVGIIRECQVFWDLLAHSMDGVEQTLNVREQN